MSRRRRQSFTLLEILIVVALIAAVAGVVTVNTMRALREDQFHASVRRVVDRLQLAQDLMLISGIDRPGLNVFVDFLGEGSDLRCKISFEGDLTGHDLRVFGQEIGLREIGRVTWRGVDGTELNLPQLAFQTLSDRIPQGILILESASRRELKRFVLMRGYPARISSQLRAPAMPDPLEMELESEQLYPQEILLET